MTRSGAGFGAGTIYPPRLGLSDVEIQNFLTTEVSTVMTKIIPEMLESITTQMITIFDKKYVVFNTDVAATIVTVDNEYYRA